MTDSAEAQAHVQDLNCPMCAYNLRGLPEPRCPECGFHFSWEELRAKARLHPYLFEYHPERNIRSFVRTLIGSLWPTRFWASINPAQESRPKRLVIYALLCILPGLIAIVVTPVRDGWFFYREMQASRAQEELWLHGTARTYDPSVPAKSWGELLHRAEIRWDLMNGRRGAYLATEQQAQDVIHQYGSISAYIDTEFPVTPSAQFFRKYYSQTNAIGEETVLLPVVVTLAVWPWLVAVTLMIFRATMRKARVRFIHLARTGVYCSCIPFLAAVGLLAVSIVNVISMARTGVYARRSFGRESIVAACLCAIVWLLLAGAIWLGIAIRRYLRFKHAALTAICVQIIFALAMMKAVLLWHGYY
jgi:hypothetical protein